MDIQSEVKCAQCHVECEHLEMDVHVYEMHTPKDFVFVCRICNHACVVVEQLLQHYTHRHRVRKQLATLQITAYFSTPLTQPSIEPKIAFFCLNALLYPSYCLVTLIVFIMHSAMQIVLSRSVQA